MKFEEALLKAVDDAFSCLGESPKEAIYFHIGKKFRLRKEDIPIRTEEFAKAIEEIFGNGAAILEIQIMKSLFKNLGYKFKFYPRRTSLKFTEYVAAVKLERKYFEDSRQEKPKLTSHQYRKRNEVHADRRLLVQEYH